MDIILRRVGIAGFSCNGKTTLVNSVLDFGKLNKNICVYRPKVFSDLLVSVLTPELENLSPNNESFSSNFTFTYSVAKLAFELADISGIYSIIDSVEKRISRLNGQDSDLYFISICDRTIFDPLIFYVINGGSYDTILNIVKNFLDIINESFSWLLTLYDAIVVVKPIEDDSLIEKCLKDYKRSSTIGKTVEEFKERQSKFYSILDRLLIDLDWLDMVDLVDHPAVNSSSLMQVNNIILDLVNLVE